MATTEERLTALETNQKAIFHQIDETKASIGVLQELTASVKLIAAENQNISKKVDKIDNRLNEIEKQPGKKWEDLKGKVVACVITGVLSALVAAGLAVILK